jgi:hypothetical protein
MKLSTILLITAASITFFVQLLLSLGYGEAYQFELANQKRIQPFIAGLKNQRFKAIVTDRVGFSIQNHSSEQGYKVRFRNQEDMKRIKFSVENDTLYITTPRRSQSVYFDAFFIEMPNTIICRNSDINIKNVALKDLKIKMTSMSFLFFEGCHIGQLKADLNSIASLNITRNSKIDTLELRLKDKSTVTAWKSEIGTTKYKEIDEKTHFTIIKKPHKWLQ